MNPYCYQRQVAELIREGKNVILQAPTGAGKTFASLWPFYKAWEAGQSRVPRKCVYVVPMRVLANQFEADVRQLVTEQLRFRTVPAVKKQTGEFKDDPCFEADITFATIDQVLSSWLIRPYSLSKRKGNLNAGAFVGSYLIFDEFHLFDPDSTLPTTLHMLKTLNKVSPFLLMTATFSKEMLDDLAAELDATPILLTDADLDDIPSTNKERYFRTAEQHLVFEDNVVVAQIVKSHLSQPAGDRRSIVVCNQVERAQRVYQALQQDGQLAGVEVRLLHSRFLRQDRQSKEEEIRREFHKHKRKHTYGSMILVGTQVIEVGLDISCRALHTELAPGAAVLQRAGRCARYENEVGHVYVYPVEKVAPYHGKEAKEQCELTWAWLEQHEGEHLDFEQEQALINHAHTPTDQRILLGLRGTAFDHSRKVYALWHGDGSRADAAALIREIQSVSVIVHANPDQLCHAPFSVPSFSLHPGTVMDKFEKWQAANDALDPDWNDGRLPWLIKRLKEEGVEEEEDVQGNRPIRYEFVKVKHKSELFAPLLVLHPDLVVYSKELGLVLSPEKLGLLDLPGTPYESDVPLYKDEQAREEYGYKLESYERHIELVYQVFQRDWSAWVAAVGGRIEQAYGWQPGIIRDVAQLVVCLHDVGKLSAGWQGWSRQWQAAVGNPMPEGTAVAHTDYDPADNVHKALNKKMGRKRPNHAVESAYATLPLLLALLPDPKSYQPLLRAAFTAISRHHGPFTSQPDSYQLEADAGLHLQATAAYLPESLQAILNPDNLKSSLNYDFKVQRGIDQRLLLQPQEDETRDVVCYMALVRALRFADQEGTRLGSK